jgi:hypothetical protein
MNDRDKRLRGCKTRALEYLDAGDLTNAVASMASECNAHPTLTLLGMQYVLDQDAAGVRRWIEGFR